MIAESTLWPFFMCCYGTKTLEPQITLNVPVHAQEQQRFPRSVEGLLVPNTRDLPRPCRTPRFLIPSSIFMEL